MYLFIIIINFLLALLCTFFHNLITAFASDDKRGKEQGEHGKKLKCGANRIKITGKAAVALCFIQILINTILRTAGENNPVMIMGYVCAAAQIIAFTIFIIGVAKIMRNKEDGNNGKAEGY